MLAVNAMSAAELSQFITFTLYVCVHLDNTANEGPRRTLLPTACEAVLAPQLDFTCGEKYLASAGSQISNLPFAHSQPPLPSPGCFPRKVGFVAVKDFL